MYLDKEKIQDLIDKQRTNLADVKYLDLDSIAKVVKALIIQKSMKIFPTKITTIDTLQS